MVKNEVKNELKMGHFMAIKYGDLEVIYREISIYYVVGRGHKMGQKWAKKGVKNDPKIGCF